MAPIAEAYVRVRPDADRFGPELTAATGKSVEQSGKTLGQRFSKSFVTVAKVGLGALAIGAVAAVKGLSSSISAASDLGETVSKVNVIFGKDGAAALDKFASSSARTMGQSKQQALDAAATFGVFGKSAGLAGTDLATFSSDFAGLASDLASFSNTSPEEAITAIGAALRGESEPIRRYGVLLDDATLRQEALKLGLIKTTKEALTPQQRVLAAQAQIYKQTKDAQGDFQRTSDGLANQQRILSASLEDTKAKIGGVFLPAATTVVNFLNDKVIPGLGGVADHVKTMFDKVDGSGLISKVGGIVTSIAQKFAPLPGAIGDIIQTTAQPLIDGILTGIRTGNWGQLGSAVGDALVNAASGAVGLARGVEAWVASVDWLALGKSSADALVPFAIGLVNEITNALIDTAIHHPMDVIAFAAAIIPVGRLAGVLEKVLGRLPIVGPILRLLASGGSKIESAAVNGIFKPIVRALDHIAPAATGAVRSVIRAVVGAFDDIVTRLYVIGDDAIKGLGRGIAGATDNVLGRLTSLVGKILRFFKADLLLDAGRDIVMGLARGIRNAAGEVVQAAIDLAGSVPKWVKKVLHIFSPSRVMVDLGKNVAEGLGKGIVDSTDFVGKKGKALADNLIQTIRDRLSDARSGLADLMSARGSAFSGIRDSITGGFLGSLTQTDADGNPIDAATGAAGFAANAVAFAKAIGDLVSAHVPPGLISAIAGAGPDQGLAAARALLSSDVGAINAAYATADTAARQAGRIIAEVEVPQALITAQQQQVALLTAAVHELQKPKDNNEVALRITKGGDLIVEYVNESNRRNERRGGRS